MKIKKRTKRVIRSIRRRKKRLSIRSKRRPGVKDGVYFCHIGCTVPKALPGFPSIGQCLPSRALIVKQRACQSPARDMQAGP